MIDRLRALLAEPLDPRAGRALAALAAAILLGFAALFVLAAHEPEAGVKVEESPAAVSKPGSAAADLVIAPTERERLPRRPQDPQDQKGSAAGRRAALALASHRALQHVPYRSDGLTVELVGAHGHRAVLRATADTVHAARTGWRQFLRRYRDSGRAYTPIFQAGGSHDG
jgi:hypothetical protein